MLPRSSDQVIAKNEDSSRLGSWTWTVAATVAQDSNLKCWGFGSQVKSHEEGTIQNWPIHPWVSGRRLSYTPPRRHPPEEALGWLGCEVPDVLGSC